MRRMTGAIACRRRRRWRWGRRPWVGMTFIARGRDRGTKSHHAETTSICMHACIWIWRILPLWLSNFGSRPSFYLLSNHTLLNSTTFLCCTYVRCMQEPGVAEKEFSPATARYLMKPILCNRFTSSAAGGEKPADTAAPAAPVEEPLPPWLTEEDVGHFVSEFERTGFTGPINYYRNMDRNWELAAPWADAKVQVPTRFIVGDGDLTYHYPGIQDYIHKGGFQADVPGLDSVVVIPGAGHFVQQEKADEVSQHIYDFISKFWWMDRRPSSAWLLSAENWNQPRSCCQFVLYFEFKLTISVCTIRVFNYLWLRYGVSCSKFQRTYIVWSMWNE